MSRSDFASRLGLRLTSSHTNANGSCFFLLSEPDRELIDLVHPPRYAVWFGGSLLASLVSTHGLSLPCPIYPLDPSPTSTLPAIRKLSTTKSAQVFADVIKSSEVLHEVRPEKKLWITCKSFFFLLNQFPIGNIWPREAFHCSLSWGVLHRVLHELRSLSYKIISGTLDIARRSSGLSWSNCIGNQASSSLQPHKTYVPLSPPCSTLNQTFHRPQRPKVHKG